MRLLGWMHKKLKQTSIEPFKDFAAGNYCTCLSAQSTLDDYTPEKNPSHVSMYGSRPFMHSYEEYENAFPEIKAEGVGKNDKDITSMMSAEFFQGFLTIGTLGLEPITEPATPTFPICSEGITEDKAEVTETDLKLMNDELEKFLEAEAEEEGYNESLGRSSYVSTITLGGLQTEGANPNDHGNTIIFPLQGYLFGSPIELPEVTPRKEKVTLGELFYGTKFIDETYIEDEEKQKKQTKTAHQFPKCLLKTMLKKFPASSGNQTSSSSDGAVNLTICKKLNKVLKMFCRKVHPENLAGKKEVNKSRDKKATRTLHKDGCSPDLMQWDTIKSKLLPGFKPMAGIKPYKNKVELPQHGLSGSNSSRNGEYWIKTDADYLVLEL